MKFSTIILTSVFCTISLLSFGQKTKEVDMAKYDRLKESFVRVKKNESSHKVVEQKSSVTKSLKVSSTPKKLNRSNNKANNKANNLSYSKSIPATRMTDNNVKLTINSEVDPSLSDVDNLFYLLEEKDAVNKRGKQLLGSDEYILLNNKIINLKSSLNRYVEAKGIQNCAPKEQNFYLASLKEEGRENEYKKNIDLIKSSK
ncbi:hypothetical protein FRY74_12705 [Vicingus serpentipes]|uniref:Uncharacterized protein n=1 Tax=Vicingus serpentipes TaxID=1926625 RepID=A0A5C6RQ83_9FLAO|nr:hypothetical protein [Vicingus serpentipes]TXB63542.1 hypothetical protein FRY74_12705 [Vicingus serpentipes]